jgi:hypothetical protein
LEYRNINNPIIDLQISNNEEYLIGVQLIAYDTSKINEDDEEVDEK